MLEAYVTYKFYMELLGWAIFGVYLIIVLIKLFRGRK
jgi:hypothetical protein